MIPAANRHLNLADADVWPPESSRGWPLLRLRFCTTVNPSRSELNGLPADTEVSFVPMESVCEYGGLRLDQTKPLADVSTGYTYFRDGDVVVAKITPCFENGKGSIAQGLTSGVGFGTTELHVLRRSQRLDPAFLFYLTISHPFRSIGAAFMHGAGGQKRVPDDFVRDFRHPIPPIDEQRAIVGFLDRETARIDALIEKKRRQIELLHEKRAALISHAVTKGLDPTAPMKDSGIDWLGQIPRTWRVLQFRRVIRALEQGWSPVAEEREAEAEEWAVLKISAVAQGCFRPSEHKALPPSLGPEMRYEVRPGDLLLTRSNTPEKVGDACYVRETRHRLLMSDLIYRLHLDQRSCLHPYACYWLISRPGRAAIEADARGTSGSMVKIAQSHIRAWPLLVPAVEEQSAIVRYLDREMSRLGVIAGKIEASIDRLREYRTALISAAVTGKLDVRTTVTEAEGSPA